MTDHVHDLPTAKLLLGVLSGLVLVFGGAILFFIRRLFVHFDKMGEDIGQLKLDVAKLMVAHFGPDGCPPTNGGSPPGRRRRLLEQGALP